MLSSKFKPWLALLLLFSTTYLVAEDKSHQKPQKRPYESQENLDHFLQGEIIAAQQQNKKLLWVLGGNWCHDSISLADKLAEAPVKDLIEANYRVSLIDVGYVKQGFDIVSQFDMKTYYATPTVLIVDPFEMKLLNEEDMHQWGRAAQIKKEATFDYFQSYVDVQYNSNAEWNDHQRALLGQLNTYIDEQEQRILTGFKLLGPLLERYKEGKKDAHFKYYWYRLAQLRAQLPKVIAKNREQIQQARDKQTTLELPQLKRLPWEIRN